METKELIDNIQSLYEKATKGPWSMHKPGCCRAIDYKDGVICQMMNNEVDMQDATGLAPTPAQAIINQKLIVALVNAWPRLKELRSEGREYVSVPREPMEAIAPANIVYNGFKKREFDETLFNLCRTDDYPGLYREFIRRALLAGAPAAPMRGERSTLLPAEEIKEMLIRANLAEEVTLPVEKFRDLCFQAMKDTQC